MVDVWPAIVKVTVVIVWQQINQRSRLSKSPFFFLVGYAILKDFIHVWPEIHRSKIQPVTSWLLTNRTVTDISRRSRHSKSQSFFFAREFITWFKSIQAKQVDLESSSLARSLRDLMHWSSLCSLLRSYERSTCSKSINAAVPTFVCMLLYNFVSVLLMIETFRFEDEYD